MTEKQKIILYIRCPSCLREKEVFLTREEYMNFLKYKNGRGTIQDMLPDIPAPERELLKGGMCGECWERIFGSAPAE